MSNALKLGLGNTVADKTVIFHGGITTRDSFGRVTDLVVVWTKREHDLKQKLSGDLRVLVQGLLEFGFPANKSTVGHLELAIENQQIYVGLRFENFIVEEGDEIEKKLAQYWLNSEESSLLKRILYPQDRVEVRFLKELNLLEWRIIRSISLESVNLDSVSFQVFSEIEDGLITEHDQFVEMGDVHYEEWISEVYQNSHEKNKSGELLQNGESIQGESEWARVVSEHDEKVVDDAVKVFKAQSEGSEAKDVSIKSTGEALGELAAKSTFVSEVDLLNEKIKQYEKLLKQKEKQNQKMGMQNLSLQEKMDNLIKVTQTTDVKQVQLFRDKAMQMFEMVKVLQAEKQVLEKTVFDLKRSGGSGAGVGAKGPNEAPGLMLQIEELTKKSDRMTRALEAEKQKVKGLLDRALLAEKEAQSSGPQITDLEIKVETANRMFQQSKKEIEGVKQKLIQSDAEKNKIKNDLLKAQAQIQTMMKRQAS